jgi:coenzyme F420-reducing hydrogenase delta subunit
VPSGLNKQRNTNKIILSIMDIDTVEIYYVADRFSRKFDGVMVAPEKTAKIK